MKNSPVDYFSERARSSVGKGKAAVLGGVSGALSFGIGQITTGMSIIEKVAMQAALHGTKGGLMSSIDGGDFGSGFAAGAVSSLVASGIEALGGLGGYYLDDDYTHWSNFASRNPVAIKAAMIASGGLSGGLSSSIAGGSFADGFRQGIITAGLNHAMHGVANKISLTSTFTKDQIKQIRENYPETDKVSLDELIELIGGEFAKIASKDTDFYNSLKGNTCATRLSYAMNKAGFVVSGKGTYNGENMKVFISANLMTNNYLIPNFTRVNIWKDSKYDYPQKLVGSYHSNAIVAQFDLSTGRFIHVDIVFNGSAGTNIYKSSYNLNFYGL